jgi:hypothetical protein
MLAHVTADAADAAKPQAIGLRQLADAAGCFQAEKGCSLPGCKHNTADAALKLVGWVANAGRGTVNWPLRL